ncbi:unnamed protein product [Rhizopus microsporus]
MGLPPPKNFEGLVKEAQELIQKKDNMENTLQEYEQVLHTAGVGMNDPLVDKLGFPRADVDVVMVRATRNQVHRLRNDIRSVTSEIERLLVEIHQMKKADESNSASTNDIKPSHDTIIPFAVVNAVAPDSPAYLAGLRRQHKIIQFGPINKDNHQGLQALNTFVSSSENQQIQVKALKEDGSIIDFTVTPRMGWGGRGSLGCHLLPL